MDTVNRILIVFDLYKDYREESNQVPVEVRNAIRLISDKQTAHLILVGCGIEEYLRDSYSKFGKDAIAKRREYCKILEGRLKAVADKLTKQHYQVTFRFLRTYPRYDQIAQLSNKYDVDLVVQHVNSNASPQRFLSANDSWQLVRTCPRSLLVVKNKDWKNSPVIIVVVDPMPSYHRPLPYHSAILDVAFQAKVQLHGNLHVVHAYSESPWPFSNTESLKNKHKKALVEMLSAYRIDPESVHLVDKTPLYALLDYKEKLEADIIIMDTLSKSKFTEAISGNLTKSVLDYLQSDLLIVKQNDAESVKNGFGR
ncbi:MAG: universal stress protein [Proteobacteria bacterium]|nr:universal stress protein [Pseudomonadota bacterium]